MSDGVELLADLTRPAGDDGEVIDTPLPVIVTISAYNKTVTRAKQLFGSAQSVNYLVKRGYAQLTVDARGTGTSGGTWSALGKREQLDAKEVVEWAAAQPWSTGAVGMSGGSYLGISQLFAAGLRPQGLRAIFPQVPSAEVYRDVVASGGMIDAGFMPLWLGIVAASAVVPPAAAPEPATAGRVLEQILGGVPRKVALGGSALTGGEHAYDGPWFEERSTLLQSVPHIDVPTFLVGGEHDLFQRGTPLLFQALKERSVPVKMLFGPWDHGQGSKGKHLVEAGLGTADELHLRWFDHHVLGLPDPTLDEEIPDFTYYELGSGRWIGRDAYLDDQEPSVWHLSGSTAPAGRPAELTQGPVTDGTSTLLPIPLAGILTRSSSQWTAGIDRLLKLPNPFRTDARFNDLAGVTFDTAPLEADLRFLGPINAHLEVSSSTGDGLLAVQVHRVRPDGSVEPITAGWQLISLAALDESRSLRLGDEIIQPWHPFTKASEKRLAPGEISGIDVEILPTGAVIRAGERLRLSVHTWEVPHLLPTLAQVASVATAVVTIHNDADHPSRLVLPALEPVDDPEPLAVSDDSGLLAPLFGVAKGLLPF